MATSPRKTATKRRASSKTTVRSGGGGLTKSRKLSWKFAAPLIAIVALVGGYTVFRSFASEPATPQNGKLLVFKADDHGFKWTAPNSGLFLIGEAESPSSSNSLAWATDKRLISPGSSRTGISPDGKRLAYLEQAAEVHLAHSNIIDGSQNERPVTIPGYGSQGAHSFKWSPSNNYIAYVHTMGGIEQRLHVTSTDGKENIDISGTLPVSENHKLRDASPQFFFNDDSLVLYATFDPVDSTIPYEHTKRNKYFRVNIHDKTAVELIPEQGFDSSEMVLSSRGEIAQWRYGSNEVLIYKLENSRFVRMRSFEISETGGHNQGLFHWSPDGTKLAINSSIYNGSTGDLLRKINDGFVILGWQPLPPEEAPIDSKKPEEPAPLSNAEYVNYIYQTCLARVPDSAGASYWTDKLDNGMSRTEFYTTFVNTQEAKDKALCTGSIPPTPAPDPTEPEQPLVDSKKPEEETPAPPPAPTAYAEPASKLVIPNTPYILRTKTSTGPAILIRASAYGTGQYVRLSDKAAVTSFLQTQKDLGKSVKTCVSHLPVNSSNAKLVIKRLNSTSQMISVPRSPAYGDLCTTAIPVTSTMVTNPNLTTVSATGYDVTIDMITLRAE